MAKIWPEKNVRRRSATSEPEPWRHAREESIARRARLLASTVSWTLYSGIMSGVTVEEVVDEVPAVAAAPPADVKSDSDDDMPELENAEAAAAAAGGDAEVSCGPSAGVVRDVWYCFGDCAAV